MVPWRSTARPNPSSCLIFHSRSAEEPPVAPRWSARICSCGTESFRPAASISCHFSFCHGSLTAFGLSPVSFGFYSRNRGSCCSPTLPAHRKLLWRRSSNADVSSASTRPHTDASLSRAPNLEERQLAKLKYVTNEVSFQKSLFYQLIKSDHLYW